MPKAAIKFLNRGVYDYKRSFAEEARLDDISDASFPSDCPELRDINSKTEKTAKRLQMREKVLRETKECSICLNPLEQCHPRRVIDDDENAPNIDTFVKTPCDPKGHRFCKICL